MKKIIIFLSLSLFIRRSVRVGGSLIILLLLLTGCKEDDPIIVEEQILGRWQWVRSTGGPLINDITPESLGETQGIEYLPDGSYYLYTDGIVTDFGKYTIGKEQGMFRAEPVYIINYREFITKQAILELSENRMLLGDECLNCSQHEFVR